MKILRVIYDLQVGGVQRMLLRMLPLLRQRGVEAHVACLKMEGELAPRFREAGIPVHLCEFRSRLDPVALWKLRRLIARERFDIAHAHMYASNVALNAATLFQRQAAIVNSYHSQTPYRGNHQRRTILRMQNLPARIVAISHAVREPLLEIGIPESRIHVIHNGVEIPAEATYPEIPAAPRPIRLMWAGRFVRQKRVGMLVDLAGRLAQEQVPFHMTLVGEGPQFNEIRARAEKLGLAGCIDLPGWQSDIRPSIRAADLYISASDREGLSNTLLEVCAQGRGFLVADIPPNREVLGNTEAGICLDDNLDNWVREIRAHQGDMALVRRRGEAAFARVHDFSVERTCDLTMELYREIWGGGG